MALCAASVAGICLAADGVESANIVGYQDLDLNAGKLAWICCSFTQVGGQDISFKLGEFLPNENFVSAQDTIQFATEDGNWEDQLTYLSKQFFIDALGEEDAEAYTPGWYDLFDEYAEYCLNDTDVPYAKGFAASAAEKNAKIRFRGEVPKANTSVALTAGKLTWMGNASVVTLKLGDIVPNENFVSAQDTIQFATEDGNWEDQLTYLSKQFFIDALGEEDAEAYTPGWYDLFDEYAEYCLNDTDVTAGKAFCASAADDGVVIVIPSPLN